MNPITKIFIKKNLLILMVALPLLVAISALPKESFWSMDEGMKFIQIQNLTMDPPGLHIRYPGESISGAPRFFPLINLSLMQNDRWVSVFPAFYALVNAPIYRYFGLFGIYGLSIISAAGIALVMYWFGKSILKDEASWLPPLATVLATPLTFYVFLVSEYPLAILLVTVGVYWAWRGLNSRQGFYLIASGFFLGLSVWFRTELYMMVAAGMIAVFLQPGEFGRFSGTRRFLVGAILGLAPMWAFNTVLYGNPLGIHVIANIVSEVTAEVMSAEQSVPFLELRRLILVEDFFPLSSKRWIALVILVTSSLLSAKFLPHRYRRAFFALGFSMSILGAIAVVIDYLKHGWMITSFVEATPLLLLIPWLAIHPDDLGCNIPNMGANTEYERSKRLLLSFSIGYLILVFLTSLSNSGRQWGGRLFMPAVPMLMLLLGFSYTHLKGFARALWPRWGEWLMSTAFVTLLVLSIGVQARGVQIVFINELRYRKVVESIANIPVIITNVDWIPHVLAPVFYEHSFFRVDSENDFCDLVGDLTHKGISTFAFISAPELSINFDLEGCRPARQYDLVLTVEHDAWTQLLETRYVLEDEG